MKNKTASSSSNKRIGRTFSSGILPVTVLTIHSQKNNFEGLKEILSQLPSNGSISYILNGTFSSEEITHLSNWISESHQPRSSPHSGPQLPLEFHQVQSDQALLPKKIYYPIAGQHLFVEGKQLKTVPTISFSAIKKPKTFRESSENEATLINSALLSINIEKPEKLKTGLGVHTSANKDKIEESIQKHRENLMAFATQLAKIGSWEVDLENDTTFLSSIGYEILEKEADSTIQMPRDLNFFKSGEDRKTIRGLIAKALNTGKSFDAELRIVTAKGNEKWIRIIGDSEGDGETRTRLFGSIQDIDSLKQDQLKLAKKTHLLAAISEIEGILLESDSLWVKLEKCFQKIGELLFVDRVYYFEYGKNPDNSEEVVSQRIEWSDKGTSSHIDDEEMTNIPVSLLGDLIPELKKNRIQFLEASSISNPFIKGVFADQHIKQAILAPIIINSNFRGFIGGDLCYDIRNWRDEEYGFLERAVSRISLAMENHEANQHIIYKSSLIQTNAKVVELLFQHECWENKADLVFKMMGESVKADRAYCFKIYSPPNRMEQYANLAYEWTNANVSSDLNNPDYQNIRLAEHPVFLKKVLLGKPFSFLTSELDGTMKDMLVESQTKSILLFPVFKFGKICGYAGFDDCSEERIWSSDEISFLKSITSNLSIAMERKEQVALIQKSNKEKNDILESIGDAFFTLDKEGKVTYWNKRAKELLHMQYKNSGLERDWYFFDIMTDPVFLTKFHNANRTQESVTFETYYSKSNLWFEANLYPSATGVTVYLKDVSEKKQSIELINQSNERYEKLTEATNDAIYDWDMTTNTVFMGKGFKTLFGYDYLHEPYSFDIWQERIHPDDRETANSLMENVITDLTGSDSYQSEYRYQMQNGEYTYVIDRGMVLRNEKNNPIRLIGAIQDISYRKTYEESLKLLNLSLQDRAKQLAISNSELEQFAFVVSHDLQEPLRMVTSFLTQLNRKYGEKLDEKAKTYIHFAVDGAKRMREIILDLLEFSRIGKQEENLEEVDLEVIVQEVLSLLRKKIENCQATFHIDRLPVINGYKDQLTQVITNLFDNAIKYRKEKTPLKVHLTVRQEKTHWEFAISDNGLGIEEEYFENIFVIFKKLHPKDDYVGTGMGLAIVKKITENWGGRVWLESSLNEGSTFYFTIPVLKSY